MRPQRINVVFLYVADLAAQRRFYETVVGFGPPAVETDDWVEYALPEGTHFALHRTSPEALAGVRPECSPARFSIVVDDLDAAWREMLAKGVRFPRPREQGPGFALAEFLDPEGNPVRLIEYPRTAS